MPRLRVLDHRCLQLCACLVIIAQPQTDALSDQSDLLNQLAALTESEREIFCRFIQLLSCLQ